MTRKPLTLPALGLILAAMTALVPGAFEIRAESQVLQHEPPVQVYQGVAFRLSAKPLIPCRSLVLHASLAGTELVQPLRLANKQFSLEVPGKSTKDRQGPITYYFVLVDQSGRSIEVNAPNGKRFQTRLAPQPLALLVQPAGGKAATDAFTVTIGLNEAFAILPPDSFRAAFGGRAVAGLTVASSQVSFPVGPGLRDGSYTVKFTARGLPGWGDYQRSWTIALVKGVQNPIGQEGPLTLGIQAAGDPADLGQPQLDQPATFSLAWDGPLSEIAGGFITPALTALTVADPTPLTLTDSSLFGVQARLNLGALSGSLLLGEAVAGGPAAYPRWTAAAGLSFHNLALNLAVVLDDQTYAGLTEPVTAMQSYVASLHYELGGREAGLAGGTAEVAYALSFPDAQAEVDWAAVQAAADAPDAPDSLKLLARLQPLLEYFPLPSTDALNPPQAGLAYRVTAWAPLGQAAGRLELSRLDEGFLSLGSPVLPGSTAVLMIALDPGRPATRPFSYDPGPVYDSPAGALNTYGLHLTGLGFALFGDPVRLGADLFRTEWTGGAEARTVRLFIGYYTYLDLDLTLESTVDTLSGPAEHLYGLEGTATRRIGRLILVVSAGAHRIREVQPDPTYGIGLELKYARSLGGSGLYLYLDLTYGDPFGFTPGPRELAWMIGGSVNF